MWALYDHGDLVQEIVGDNYVSNNLACRETGNAGFREADTS